MITFYCKNETEIVHPKQQCSHSPNVHGTRYNSAGWPCPSIRKSARYVRKRPKRGKLSEMMLYLSPRPVLFLGNNSLYSLHNNRFSVHIVAVNEIYMWVTRWLCIMALDLTFSKHWKITHKYPPTEKLGKTVWVSPKTGFWFRFLTSYQWNS
jgi:hypothetical protein